MAVATPGGVAPFSLDGFAGYSLRSSPFEPGLWAVASAANYGVVGNGRLHVVREASGALLPLFAFETNAGLYDCAWSEQSAHQLLCACADGSVKLYDLEAAAGGRPVMAFCEHEAEVNSVEFNLTVKDSFASSAWDGSIRVWQPERQDSVLTLAEHTHVVYECRWAPHHASRLLSASGDRTAKLWDPAAGVCSVMTIDCGPCEVLSCDWNKYDPNVFVTGSVDKTVSTWDIRAPAMPTNVLAAHNYAVRRVRFDPHSATLLASASYDTTVCLWDIAERRPSDAGAIAQYNHHTEFVMGVEWSLFQEGVLASCAWDGCMSVWHTHMFRKPF